MRVFVDFEETNFQDYSSDVKPNVVEKFRNNRRLNKISKKMKNLEILIKQNHGVRNRIIHDMIKFQMN